MEFGTGSALLGGTSPLQEAVARRGGEASVLQQQTPASAGFEGQVPQQLADSSAPTPQGGGAPAPAAAPTGTPPMPQDSTEAQVIIDALTTRLKHDSKMKEKDREVQQYGGIPMV